MHMNYYIYLFIIFYVREIFSTESNESLQWTWSCENENCVKSLTPYQKNGTTLEVCKLLCGKYRTLWPKPTGKTILGTTLFSFHPSKILFDLKNVEDSPAKEHLRKVSKIFQNKMFKLCGSNCSFVPHSEIIIHFNVISPSLQLNWKTDESYSLEILKKENSKLSESIQKMDSIDIKINSTTVYGCRHGLETISQLTTSLSFKYSNEMILKRYLVVISSAEIHDSPVYPHRGLLLDTARHYMSVKSIHRTIEAMSMTKLNVLHWHATDSQSFPLEISKVPQLVRYGSYSPEQIYTKEDIIRIVEYAKFNGIRVIIEIDGPAHAGNGWQWGEYHNLGKLSLCVNQQPWRKYCIQPPCGQLNPINDNVYKILKNIYEELIEILPESETLHLGGDEVFFQCWNSSSEILDWLSRNNMHNDEKGLLDLWGIYQEKVLQAFSEAHPTKDVPVILWSSTLTEPEVIEKYLNKSRYIIETWLPAASPIPTQLLNKGYKLILSTKDKWYLDHGFWGNTVYHSWKIAYDNKLPRHSNVLGGEAAMWSEKVDEQSLDMKVWPRTAAVGERLWSNPKSGANAAEKRFESFRERLVKFDIRADVTSPYYCYQNDQACS